MISINHARDSKLELYDNTLINKDNGTMFSLLTGKCDIYGSLKCCFAAIRLDCLPFYQSNE